MPMTWIRISQVLQAIGETEELVTLEASKVINMERITDTKLVLREITKPDGLLRLGVQTEKLKRLTTTVVEDTAVPAARKKTNRPKSRQASEAVDPRNKAYNSEMPELEELESNADSTCSCDQTQG